MQSEMRIIKASLFTGISDLIFGIVMAITGWHQWYYDHFHFFGVVGISMVFYAYFHFTFYLQDQKISREEGRCTKKK